MSATEIDLDIFVRAHTRVLTLDPDEQKSQPKQLPQWAEHALVIDVETTIGLGQKLNFGFYRWCKLQPDGHYACEEEGIFHNNGLDNRAMNRLHEFARTHKAHVAHDNSSKILVMSRDQFVEGPLWDIIMAGGVLVGYNLPFDISRLAQDDRPTAKNNGWSFVMFTYPSGIENIHRPRITIVPKDSHTAFIRLAGGCPRENGKPIPCSWPVPRGRFLDLLHMVTAMRSAHLSLDSACRSFKVAGKLSHKPTGRVTAKEIRYARQDVAATLDLLNAVMCEFGSFGLSIRPEQVFSTASLTKAFLKDMGLTPPQIKFKNITDYTLGCAAQAYHGGRSECRIRCTDVPAVIYDVTSEYPTVAANLAIWELVRAKEIRIEDCTQEARELLSSLTVEQLLDRSTWRRLAFFANIMPKGELLPVRARYAGKTLSTGVNHLYSEQSIWSAGPDLAASSLDGKAPEVIEAFRLVPVGIQDGLQPIQLGTHTFDPSSEDFFVKIVEERNRLKRIDKNHPHVLLLKIVANSVYGCFSELNPRTFDRHHRQQVEVFSGDIHHIESRTKVEVPGRYTFIPAASLITAGGRLMLALAQKLIQQSGGSYAMMDTDSVVVVSSESGGQVPCDNGPERMPNGRPAVRALTWNEADKIFQQFDAISPFDPTVVPHLFRKEDANLRANGHQAELKYFGVASKVYTCFRGNPAVAEIVKPSQLVLGTYFRPDERPWIQAHDCADGEKYPPLIFDDWRFILRSQLCDGLVLGDWPHPFINKTVMRKVRITTPRQLKSFHQLAPEKARPFSFCMSPILARYLGHEKLMLLAPLNSNPGQWNRIEYVDAHTGKLYRLQDRSETAANRIVQDDSDTPMPQLYGNVLFALQNHHEAKSAGGDGVGLLGRWHVRAKTTPRVMGKEIDRELVAGESFSEISPEPQVMYEPAKQSSVLNKRTLDPMLIDRLKSKYPSMRRLAKDSKLNFRTIRRALNGQPIHERNWQSLMSVAHR
jgi:hypothetical protein